METEYRIMEDGNYFFIQEKIYEEYNLKEYCLNLFLIVPHRYRWSIICRGCSKTLEGAKYNLSKIKSEIKTEPKYHQV